MLNNSYLKNKDLIKFSLTFNLKNLYLQQS